MASNGAWRRLGPVSGGALAHLDALERLAREVAATSSPLLYWYLHEPPALVLGQSQRPEQVDLAATRRAGLEVAIRRAGGTAVLADAGLLSLAAVLPASHPLVDADLTASYRWLGEALAEASRRLGVPAAVVSVPEARADRAALERSTGAGRARATSCFGTLSPYEVVVDGRKLWGLAQVRRRGVALYVAGLLRDADPGRLADFLAVPVEDRPPLADELRRRAVSLSALLGRAPDEAEVVATVEATLQATLGVRVVAARRS